MPLNRFAYPTGYDGGNFAQQRERYDVHDNNNNDTPNAAKNDNGNTENGARYAGTLCVVWHADKHKPPAGKPICSSKHGQKEYTKYGNEQS